MRPIRIPLKPAGRSPPRSRVPLRPAGQSPPRSRVADLPSSGWPISASLEAISRHKGQTAPPPNRPPYEGIEGQPLHHGSKDGRRQTATPAVDVTGATFADPGHVHCGSGGLTPSVLGVVAEWLAFNASVRRVVGRRGCLSLVPRGGLEGGGDRSPARGKIRYPRARRRSVACSREDPLPSSEAEFAQRA